MDPRIKSTIESAESTYGSDAVARATAAELKGLQADIAGGGDARVQMVDTYIALRVVAENAAKVGAQSPEDLSPEARALYRRMEATQQALKDESLISRAAEWSRQAAANVAGVGTIMTGLLGVSAAVELTSGAPHPSVDFTMVAAFLGSAGTFAWMREKLEQASKKHWSTNPINHHGIAQAEQLRGLPLSSLIQAKRAEQPVAPEAEAGYTASRPALGR